MARIAINGLGRIGRAALKVIYETDGLELMAANDLVPPENLSYLLAYDTVYGRYEKDVAVGDGTLIVGGKPFYLSNKKDPGELPWKDLNIDIVLECTGHFTRREDLEKHILAGAKAVILSAPSKSNDIPSVVYGVNNPPSDASIISCASCTTNCITPAAEVMDRRIGVRKALMTTIHAYTSTQNIVDGPSKKIRRGRAGAANFVPTSTGAASAATRALPSLAGKFDGVAVRAPITLGSISDIIFLTSRETTVDEINGVFEEESRTDRYDGILGVTTDPIVSSDIIADPRASIVDLGMTRVTDGDLVKVMSWYDNEWGYTNQMIRVALEMAQSLS